MYILSMLIHLLACQTSVQTPVEAPQITTSEAAPLDLVKVLSGRHDTLTCNQLQDRIPNLQTQLENIVDEVKRPPWAAMKAAQCIIELYPSSSEHSFKKWMLSPNTRGLAILLSNRINSLPPKVSPKIVDWGHTGPHAEVVVPRINQQIDASKNSIE